MTQQGKGHTHMLDTDTTTHGTRCEQRGARAYDAARRFAAMGYTQAARVMCDTAHDAYADALAWHEVQGDVRAFVACAARLAEIAGYAHTLAHVA